MIISLQRLQTYAWSNKLYHGLDTTDVPGDVERLIHEARDGFLPAFQAGDKDAAGLALADIVLFAAGLAQMLGVELQDCVEEKLRINAAAEKP